MLRKTIKK